VYQIQFEQDGPLYPLRAMDNDGILEAARRYRKTTGKVPTEFMVYAGGEWLGGGDIDAEWLSHTAGPGLVL
jgi:hypothetical protein